MVMAQMKFRFALVIVLFASLILFANTNVAQAQWSAINSKQGCAVTTNVHGQTVAPSQEVTAWAGTINPAVKSVELTWKDPNGETAWNDWPLLIEYTTSNIPGNVPQEIKSWADAQNPVISVWLASSSHTPEDHPDPDGQIIGDWTVKAHFSSTGSLQATQEDRVAIRATSLVVDEVPFGTIVILLIPFGFLSVYAIKRKHNTLRA